MMALASSYFPAMSISGRQVKAWDLGWSVLNCGREILIKRERWKLSKTLLTRAIPGPGDQCEKDELSWWQ